MDSEEEILNDPFLNTSNFSIASYAAEEEVVTSVDRQVSLDTEIEPLESLHADFNFVKSDDPLTIEESNLSSRFTTSPEGAKDLSQMIKSGGEVQVTSQQQEASCWYPTAQLESSNFSSLGYRTRFLSESLFPNDADPS